MTPVNFGRCEFCNDADYCKIRNDWCIFADCEKANCLDYKEKQR